MYMSTPSTSSTATAVDSLQNTILRTTDNAITKRGLRASFMAIEEHDSMNVNASDAQAALTLYVLELPEEKRKDFLASAKKLKDGIVDDVATGTTNDAQTLRVARSMLGVVHSVEFAMKSEKEMDKVKNRIKENLQGTSFSMAPSSSMERALAQAADPTYQPRRSSEDQALVSPGATPGQARGSTIQI